MGREETTSGQRAALYLSEDVSERREEIGRVERDGAPLRVPFRDGRLICIPILGRCRSRAARTSLQRAILPCIDKIGLSKNLRSSLSNSNFSNLIKNPLNPPFVQFLARERKKIYIRKRTNPG